MAIPWTQGAYNAKAHSRQGTRRSGLDDRRQKLIWNLAFASLTISSQSILLRMWIKDAQGVSGFKEDIAACFSVGKVHETELLFFKCSQTEQCSNGCSAPLAEPYQGHRSPGYQPANVSQRDFSNFRELVGKNADLQMYSCKTLARMHLVLSKMPEVYSLFAGRINSQLGNTSTVRISGLRAT